MSDFINGLTPGVYERAGEIFIVKANKEKSRLYAKRLVNIGGERLTEVGAHEQFDFEYAPGAIYDLHPENQMPFDRARELTIRYGRCINCGRFLKDAKSVELGIGPVCRKAFRG